MGEGPEVEVTGGVDVCAAPSPVRDAVTLGDCLRIVGQQERGGDRGGDHQSPREHPRQPPSCTRRRRPRSSPPGMHGRATSSGGRFEIDIRQVAPERSGALRAVVRVLRQEPGHEGRQGERHGGIELVRAPSRRVHMLVGHRHRVRGLEGGTPDEHLEQHASQGVEIGARVRVPRSDTLRREVRGGAQDLARRRQGGCGSEPRDAEVAELHLSFRRHEDVRWLHVAVDDALRMNGRERARDAGPRSRPRGWERASLHGRGPTGGLARRPAPSRGTDAHPQPRRRRPTPRSCR